jgi:eukaryotic-like serine/threonine-protein kinase
MANAGDPSGPKEGDRPEHTELTEPGLPPKRTVSLPGRPVAPDPEPGEVVGGYALLERLGRGGAGSVFKARAADGNICALKVLAASKVKRARVVQRFFDEVRAASAVKHPGLIRVLDFVEEEEPRRLAYAMEYLEGESLRDKLKREHTIGLREAMDIGAQICEALHALHQGGIIHRDLKPENIMIAAAKGGRPLVKLLDFGVVKFLPVDPTGGVKDTEKPGTFVGTPRYMAPEQAAGAAVDPRADLFSIGVILFEMITGRCPHEGDSLRDVVLAKLKGAPRITVNPEKEVLPQELTDMVDACLRLKSSLRPKDAQAVANGLREAEVVLFTVGPIRLAPDGTTKREPSGDLPSDTAPTPPPAAPKPRARTQTPVPRANTPAPRGPTTGSRSSLAVPNPPEPTPRSPWLIALLLAGMLFAGIAIAMVARRLTKEDDAALLVLPDAPPPPVDLVPTRIKATVQVNTDPPGATVHVGDTAFGPTPVAVVAESGERLLVALDGYQLQAIEVGEAPSQTINLTLAKTSTIQ